jgi:tetratricopeptide (TPR) repeat protein/O-antigen ligase
LLTRLGQIADKVIEYGWLVAAIFAPLFFNVYSSRVFEPDKISTLRSIVLVMALAWLIKVLEGGVRAYRESEAPMRVGRLQDAVGGSAERGLPGWLGWLRVPMLLPIAVYALAYLLSTLFTVTMDASLFGSYQRLQGTYTQYTYMLLGVMVIANLRTRTQLERLINIMILTSVPVVMYGFLQAAPLLGFKLDPLPWAGDTTTRVASTMGNAIFVAAWLIMVVPLVMYRLFSGLSASIAARQAAEKVPQEAERARGLSRRVVADTPSYGWAAVATGLGIIFTQLFIFYLALKVMAGLPFPDASLWWVLPGAMLMFFLGCLLLEALGKRIDDSRMVSRFLPLAGAAVFVTALIALPFDWRVQRVLNAAGNAVDFRAQVSFDAGRVLWVMFFVLLWGAISAGVYTLASGERLRNGEESPVMRSALNWGYGVLLAMLLGAIYLTQSRGPWLGLGAGLVTFAVAMWLVGRQYGVRWMRRLGGTVSAIAAGLAAFVILLNVSTATASALSNLPFVGRGIERLSTLTRTEDGTGKVRTLIWEGATDLILSDPMRTLIGWGPEAMYVAYAPHYPAELAHWELRNATPDRSHNVEFDQLVTMGVVGLLAYYFLVGAFFFYAMRLLRRVSTTRDRLMVIALIAAMVAHFIEIQTGIQIASTWTYFYLIIGMMVAYGYYVTNHLRPEAEVVSSEYRVAATDEGAQKPEGRRQKGAENAVAATGGSQPAARSSKASQAVAQRGAQPARRRQGSQQVQVVRDVETRRPYSAPWKLAIYAVAGLVVWAVNFGLNLTWIGIPINWPGINSATVRADSLYKVGLQYDAEKLWPESISYYRQAIGLQEGQDYYYLFLGRSWLEFAKQVDNERAGSPIVERAKQTNENWGDNWNWRVLYRVPLDVPCEASPQEYASEADREAERLCRLRQGEWVLQKAHQINPLNTDHFANLGRLYLYWADATGGKDPLKSKLAVSNLEAATQRSPGNAQLWDELAVAYARDGQFAKAMETLDYSQNEVDAIYARTPFLKGQLLQERATAVRAALVAGQPLPTEGETDMGKLVLGVGQAYSDTIGIEPTSFVDGAHEGRLDFILAASQPFTQSNSTLPAETVRNVLTSTVTLALEREAMESEQALAKYLREQGAFTGGGNIVPSDVLLSLWQDSRFSGPAPVVEGQPQGRQWTDANIPATSRNAVASYGALGYIYEKTGRTERARETYNRLLALDPNNSDAQADLNALSP